MHAYELQQSINRFFAELERFQPFTEALSALAQSAKVMESHLPAIAKGANTQNHGAAQIYAHLAHTQRTISVINHRLFFKSLEHFQRCIAQFQPLHASKTDQISSLNAEVEKFAVLYDAFLSNQSGENALPLLLAAQALQCKLGVFLDSLQLFEESVGAYDVAGSSEAPFALLLPGHLDLAEFAHRLLAIQSLYSELCMLLSVSESTHPLRISKIESGSLWAKVFGESRVVGMMASFVEQTASWMYRTYTTEGKLASIPRKVEMIDSLLGLTQRLKEAGLDTSGMEEHIEKSAVSLSKSLSAILDGQSSIVVNEQTISVGSELSKIVLERTAPLQLSDSNLTPSDEPAEPLSPI